MLVESDSDHEKARQLQRELGNRRKVTTDAILVEVLAYVSGHGPQARAEAVGLVRDVRANPSTKILPQTRELFDAGLALYAARLDKAYSLTDCMSMIVCRDLGITNVLSHDRHFAQEGLTILL